MKPKGMDMGDYEALYKDCDIEVAVEQVLTGVKAHWRVLKGMAGRAWVDAGEAG